MTDEIARGIASHLAEWHTYDREQVAQMVKEHDAMVEDLDMMIVDLYGERSPIPGDPDRRVGGRFANGGVGVKLSPSPGAWAALAALIVTLGSIAVALVAG